MQHRSLAYFFVFMDLLTSALAWTVFYYLRKTTIEHVDFNIGESFYWGIILIPVLWVLLYYLQGTYHDIKRLYRIKLFNLTFLGTLLGSVFIFFTLLLDDEITEYHQYYKSMFLLFGIHFLIVFIPRLILISAIVGRIHSGKYAFKTLLIGGSDKAVEIYNEILSLPKGINKFIGFVNINGVDRKLEDKIQYLGHLNDLESVLRENEVEEVIIALESTEHDKLRSIISRIEGGDTKIKILPDMYDILSGTVKMSNIFGAILIEVNAEAMPIWQQALKRFMDVVLSVIAIIMLVPVYIALAVGVKMSSPGPIFFLQERVGLNGKPFKIIKFRTMYQDAEKTGPQLSSANDPRITSIGRFMRKLRLDEFPQFFNVLKGDMSLVGPRPERQFYIDQIVEIEPQFLHLTKARPGITSWGQVKYGYAENVDQMLQRMKFDLLYMKNRTLALDIKIMLYTVLIILKAKGK
ncbi:MAG: sugar transferase [Flavobacteriia bacterium]|jgi:exopolysaccharide biosynthesis polyprenyl glycosylphosphotransferase